MLIALDFLLVASATLAAGAVNTLAGGGTNDSFTIRNSADRGEDRVIIFEHRDNQDANVWIGVEYFKHRIQAIDAWHLEIHQDHIGLEAGS
jgi:hypothetical protein